MFHAPPKNNKPLTLPIYCIPCLCPLLLAINQACIKEFVMTDDSAWPEMPALDNHRYPCKSLPPLNNMAVS